MTSLRTATAAAVVAGGLALGAGPALAQAPPTTVHCGQTLTTSVRLANDLTDCPGDGLVVGADGITVDLNGHTIDGVPGTSCDRPATFARGVEDAGFDGVTIENGTVRQFDVGVAAGSGTDGLSHGRIDHMTLRDDAFGGVSLGTGGGAALMARDLIDRNAVSGSVCGEGLKLNSGRDNRFTNNRIQGSDTGITICCSAQDVDNVVQGNTITESGGVGILLFGSASDELVANTIDGAGDTGIVINGQTSNDLVRGNAIAHTQEAGMVVVPCCGDNPEAPTAVRVVDNTLTATADGILVIQSDGNEVLRNTLLATGTFGDQEDFGVGVLVDAGSHELVTGNTLANGRGPGVMVGVPPELAPSPGPVDGSAAYGIEAVPGVTDGGGNIAHGNGNAAQCTGVACS